MSASCKAWKAVHDFMPPLPARLNVSGECTMPTPGFTITLKPAEPQGINPSILILEKTVTPPTGIEPQHVVTQPATYHELTDVHYTHVMIMPDNFTMKVEEVF
jgi:hypothetical protein